MQILLDIRQNENGLNYLFDILKKNGVQAPFDCGCGVGVAIDRYIEEDFNMIWGSDFQSELITGLQQKFKNKQKVNFFVGILRKYYQILIIYILMLFRYIVFYLT